MGGDAVAPRSSLVENLAGHPDGVEDFDPRDGFPPFCPRPPDHFGRRRPFLGVDGGDRVGGRVRGRPEVVVVGRGCTGSS